MGRLVKAMSQEEFNKLPKWQQWINKHPFIFFGAFFTIFAVIYVVVVTFS